MTALLHTHSGDGEKNIVLLYNIFFVDKENNIPSWFSSISLFVSGLLSLAIGYIYLKLKIANGFYWISIGIVFFYLSLDEDVQVHEYSIASIREATQAGGIFYFSWIIPALIIIVVFSFIYGRFIFALPTTIRRILLTSAAVYLGGAIGMEMAGGYYYESSNEKVDLTYSVLATIEEFMEMIGVSIFIYGLLRHIETSPYFEIFLKRRTNN